MARSGRKYVSIEAPIMKVQGAYIWMDRYWPEDLFKWMRQEKMVFTEIKMPLDWRMIIGEAGQSEMHVLPITSLNDRGFDAFTFNPISSSKPDFYPIDIVDIYTEVKWYFPKIKSGQLLAVPLEDGPKPVCAYFVKDISRQCEQIDYGNVW